jgi:predicted peroxiredoxin
VQTRDEPERQYSPLILAQTAKAMDLDAKVYYLGQGLKIARALSLHYPVTQLSVSAASRLSPKVLHFPRR